MDEDRKLSLSLSAKRFALILFAGAVAFTLLSVVARVAGRSFGLNQSKILRVLFINTDDSIPSYYAALLLLTCAVVVGLITHERWISGGRWRSHWMLLSVMFAYLSTDEAISIHERFTPLGREILGVIGISEDGPIARAWVVPGIAVLIVVLLAYLPFFMALPRRTKFLFALSVFVFFGGAIGLEIAADLYAYALGGVQNLTLSQQLGRTLVFTHVEELVEMIGSTIFIYGSLDYARRSISGYEISLLK